MKIFLTLFVLVASLTHAQTQTFSFKGGSFFLLPEVGALIIYNEGVTEVKMTAPREKREKGYEDVDLKANDKIIMANGKKIKNANDLKEIYEATAVGDEIKLGVKREERMFIVSIKKSDQKGSKKQTIVMSGDADQVRIISELGIVLAEENDAATVKKIIDPDNEIVKSSKIEEGDVLKNINDKNVSDVEDFNSIFDKLEEGASVKLIFNGKGQKKNVSFDKKANGTVTIKRGN